MKLLSHLILLAAFTMLAITIVSCKKVVDKLYKDPLATLDACYINKITIDSRTYVFTYNKKGNPVSVLNNDVGTGNPNYYFKYDKHHRLTDWILFYSRDGDNFFYDTWHKFVYDRYNRIIKDTAYGIGANGPVPDPASNYIALGTYTYDSYNRIIRYDVKFVRLSGEDLENPYTDTYTYNYNSAGNLNGYIYDNKVNLNRTNKFWMFINKDYSLNNRIGATSYNKYMLPLGFENISSIFLHFGLRNSVIDYICKDDGKE